MTTNFKYENTEDQTTLTIGSNRGDPSLHDLYVSVDNDETDRNSSMAVVGADNIRRSIYAMAIAGGLIKEGETLTIENLREIPEDGAYLLTANGVTSMATVEGGKLFVAQVNSYGLHTGHLVDVTSKYTPSSSTWDLRKMVKP